MTQLLEKYKAYLPADTGTYSSAKFQDRLVRHYAGSIVIHTQRCQGMSNLVFSDKLSLGDTIAAAGKYKSKFKASELENDFQVDVEGVSDEKILHSAVGILRRNIEKLKISVEDYPSANDISIAASMDKLPQSLVRFLCWLIDAKSFESATEPYTMPTDKIRKALSITDSIVSVSKQLFTPFHLGLAVQLYHEFGSRHLIDTLYSHGFCTSYDEVRRYITSNAQHEISKIQDDVYVPDGITPLSEGGCLIQEGADNIDLNTETIDGKGSFSDF
jgi:hypothetical protein